MPSKFAQFLEKNKIDPRRVLAASRKLEHLQPEDRALRLGRRQSKAAGTPPAPPAEGEKRKKPRSGRPVTPRLMQAAESGKPLTGPAKTRLLRALNHLLSQKKREPVDLRSIF